MAVYTPVSATELAEFLSKYDVGHATSCKGIAEGVQNSNYLIDTNRARFILTLYERTVVAADLPWYLALMTHMADRHLPVPRPVIDRDGVALQTLNGRPACLIEFASGVSVTEPSPAQCHAVGAALGRLHREAVDFKPVLANALGQASWRPLADSCGAGLANINKELPQLIADALAAADDWPRGLPICAVHTDLFPDNVLMQDDSVTALIDFYFACTDARAYDYAVTHAAWCFSAVGGNHYPARAAALAAGYAETNTLDAVEIAALPRLGQGAALRFTLTRCYDWLNTPPGALVRRHDPMAFARRMLWYGRATPDAMLGK